mgnify:CR=1 FL=1
MSGKSRRPERIVHLGVGAFFRAHQAWYTDQVDRDGQWGIVGYTGRSATVAKELAPQDGKYSLITRSAHADQIEVIESLVRVEDGANVADLVETIAKPGIARMPRTAMANRRTGNGARRGPTGRHRHGDLCQRLAAALRGVPALLDARIVAT